MRRSILQADIVGVTADALIYSTNVQLMLSGGVGACLLEKFGHQFQADLYRKIDRERRKLAEVGEVFFSDMAHGPWKVIVHSIATDPFYHTDPEVVRAILHEALAGLEKRGDVQSVLLSPLGAGYGDLEILTFIELVTEVSRDYEGSRIKEVIICCDSEPAFRELVDASSVSQADWSNKGEQGGAGQPATRSESDLEGGDKPQPESEGRSR